MFNIKHNECVGFESKWEVKKVSTESTSQTTEFSSTDKMTNTIEKEDKHVQTNITDPIKDPDVDMKKLAKWLSQIYPDVKKQIDNVNNSTVFRNYRLLDDNVDATCTLIQRLKIGHLENSGDKAMPKVAGTSWNLTGKQLAVVCNFKHKSWCYHSGQVIIYSFIRYEKLSETPKKRLSTESCVTVLKFHPRNDNILAAGSFTGQIYIWNVENDIDPLLCNVSGHDQAVSQISWISDSDDSHLSLGTSSSDGLLKLWNFSTVKSSLKIKTILKIKPPIFGQICDSIIISKSLSNQKHLGVVCFDFSKHIPDIFVVGLEGGLIARCSILGSTQIKDSQKNTPMYDPVYSYYQPHKGELISIKFSMSSKDIFLTSGTDGEIRIYLVYQEDPAQIIFTKASLNDISFLPHELHLLATCGQKSSLEVYNLQTGKPIELVWNTKVEKRMLTSMAINMKRENIIVIGNDIGELLLWNIPWNLLK